MEVFSGLVFVVIIKTAISTLSNMVSRLFNRKKDKTKQPNIIQSNITEKSDDHSQINKDNHSKINKDNNYNIKNTYNIWPNKK